MRTNAVRHHSVHRARAAGWGLGDRGWVLHYSEALDLVGAAPDEPDLAPEHECFLGKWAKSQFDSDFLAVEGYPASKRPFCTHPQPDDPRWTNSFDLLFRGLELVTGGQRLHNRADYIAALTARGQDPADYGPHLEAMGYGMPPQGASLSVSSAGSPAYSKPTTSGTPRSFLGKSIGFAPDRPLNNWRWCGSCLAGTRANVDLRFGRILSRG